MDHSKPQKPFLRSGELARLVGVSTDTLRHYERIGLLTPSRASNGYRQFSAAALHRVRLVRRAIAMGFRLQELARLLQARDRGGIPCQEVHALVAAKREALDAKIQELMELRDSLQAMLEEWDARLAETPEGERAWLLESLAS